MEDQGMNWWPAVLEGALLAMVLAILISTWSIESTLSAIAKPSLVPITPGRP